MDWDILFYYCNKHLHVANERKSINKLSNYAVNGFLGSGAGVPSAAASTVKLYVSPISKARVHCAIVFDLWKGLYEHKYTPHN